MLRLQYNLMLFKVLMIPRKFLNPIRVIRLTPRLANRLTLLIKVPPLISRVMVPTPTHRLLMPTKELCGTETSESGLDPGPASIRTALAWHLSTLLMLLKPAELLCLLELRTS